MVVVRSLICMSFETYKVTVVIENSIIEGGGAKVVGGRGGGVSRITHSHT